MKLRKRKVSSYHFYGTKNGKRYSIVNIAGMMESILRQMPNLRNSGMFLGWEAAEIIDGKMNFDTLYRAATWEELEKQL